MKEAYLISQGLDEFAAAREQFAHLVSELQSGDTLGLEHGDVEKLKKYSHGLRQRVSQRIGDPVRPGEAGQGGIEYAMTLYETLFVVQRVRIPPGSRCRK